MKRDERDDIEWVGIDSKWDHGYRDVFCFNTALQGQEGEYSQVWLAYFKGVQTFTNTHYVCCLQVLCTHVILNFHVHSAVNTSCHNF